jgi:nucleotide-binding universal stress UspA family protein
MMVHVHVDGEVDARVRLAAKLADRFQSHLIGVSVWMPRPRPLIDPDLAAAEFRSMSEAMNKSGDKFRATIGIDGRRIELRSCQAVPVDYIAREARAADLLIISRQREIADPYLFPDPAAVVLAAGRPVLAVPPGVETLHGRKVVVAWKDAREARRAVRDALPFLQRADEVIVTEICERSEEVAPSQQRLRDVAGYLRAHGVATVAERVRPIGGEAVNTLLHLVHDESADLIVAGAYGHSRVGEWMFGGMTQGLFDKSPVCCLLSH